MKKHFVMMVALLVAVAIAMPALAAVEFKYGGQFRARVNSSNNMFDGSDDRDDHDNWIDQRLRLYFTFQASENLKVVAKFEMGDTVWGQQTPGFGEGGRVGADTRTVEVKNAYMQFNIPCTPTTAVIGIQGINLLDSWIVDDDLAGALFVTKMDPFKVTVGYVAGQNNPDTTRIVGIDTAGIYNRDGNRLDDFVLSLDYASGPFAASLVGFYQAGHNTFASVNPYLYMATPMPLVAGSNIGPFRFEDNNLYDIGANFTYKVDWLKVYISGVMNFGSVDVFTTAGPNAGRVETKDYKGWMVDAGATYFCGPWSMNLGGFYTTGNDLEGKLPVAGIPEGDLDWFTYPLATAKYTSEIVGGGILDHQIMSNGYWSGYKFTSNVWTVTAGASWQVLDQTKLALSYWYWNTTEDVPSFITTLGNVQWDNELGHEIDLYVTQGIVDGLTLDLVGAYMFTGDAYGIGNDDDIYEVGARLQWSF